MVYTNITYRILRPYEYCGSIYGDYGYVLNGVKSEKGYVSRYAARKALERKFNKMRKAGEITLNTIVAYA